MQIKDNPKYNYTICFMCRKKKWPLIPFQGWIKYKVYSGILTRDLTFCSEECLDKYKRGLGKRK